MLTTTFDYEGHSVTISSQARGNKLVHWFIIDGHPVSFTSNPGTAKRLAIRFIEVVNDAHFKTSRQAPLYKPGLC